MGNNWATTLVELICAYFSYEAARPELGRRAVEGVVKMPFDRLRVNGAKMPNDQAQGERCQIGETSLLSKNEIHITHQFESHPYQPSTLRPSSGRTVHIGKTVIAKQKRASCCTSL
jgi:hypothetical protein